MDRKQPKDRQARLDADLKAMLDTVAAEGVPEHLIDLVDELDRPPRVPKTG